MGAIYRTRGRAREFAAWGLTIFDACEYACPYCFNVTHEDLGKPREAFFGRAKLRQGVVNRVAREAPRLFDREGFNGATERVLVSFGSDPYPPSDHHTRNTRRALTLLATHHVPFEVLTKAPHMALRDGDVLSNAGARMATTVTGMSEAYRDRWEPNVQLPICRLAALEDMKREHGVETWLSIEPVMEPDEAADLLRYLADNPGRYADHVKIGKANHMPEVDAAVGGDKGWSAFGRQLAGVLPDLGVPYYVKQSTRPYLPTGFNPDTLGERSGWD